MRPDPLPASDPRVDAFIEALPSWQEGICREVRALVHAADRDVRETINGRGIGSAAVAYAVGAARTELGLHRLQAATLPHNAASQTILRRSGFEEIGRAPSYLQTAGAWQDHILYQRILF